MAPPLRPILCVYGVQGSPADTVQLLTERGFVTCGIFAEDSANTELNKDDYEVKGGYLFRVALALSKRLTVSQALDAGLEVKEADMYSKDEVVRLSQAAMSIIHRAPINFQGVMLLHDYTLLSEITASMDVHKMNAYFGSEIALYFAWLRYYTKYLWIAAVVGLPLFLLQLWTGEVDSPYAGFFSIFIAFWGTCFLEFWKRENSTLAFTWGVHDIEEDEQEREIVKRFQSKSGGGQRWKFAATIPLLLISIGFVLRVMLYFVWLQDNAEDIYGESWLQYWPTVIYSIAPVVFAYLFEKLAVTLTKFEAHSTRSEYANSLIMKQVAFQFVNCYSVLFYIAFWLKDIDRLRGMLMSLLVMKQVLNNLIEMSVPYHAKAVAFVLSRIGLSEAPAPVTDAASPQETSGRTPDTERLSGPELADEISRPQYDLESDYLELVIQYGYITMFAVAFPLAPALALLNNLVEAAVDMFKLSKSRRPPIVNRSTIGAWYYALEAISFVSVLTNCALLALVSEHMHHIVPSELHPMLDSQYGKLSVMIALEHVILGVKYILSHAINDIPGWLRQNLAVENQKRKAQLQQERRMLFDAGPPAETSDASKEISERQVAINKLQSEYATGFFFSPMVLLVLVFTPYLIIYLDMPAWYTIPLGIIFVSYLQASKERADRQAACGIISDSRVLRLIMEELPGWVYDSEVERAEWLNKIINRLWNDVSGAVKDIVMTQVQPILDANKPALVTSLGFREVDLGKIAPKIVGVRVLSTEEHLIRMDLEFKWAGTAEIVLEVGRKEMPLLVELSNLQCTGKLRVEFAPLIPRLPLFGALSITFLKPPHVDFNFKVASMNLMNLGAADYNIANLVGATIRSVIKGMMLYPKKLVIPMMEDVDLHDFTHATPRGVLNLVVVSASNLIIADFTSSDPYAVIKFMDDEYRTPVIWKTLNPVWNFMCDILVYDAKAQIVELTVYDKDIGTKDDFMGRAELHLGNLVPGVTSELDLPLIGVKSGSIKVRATYSRLAGAAEGDASTDILFNVSKGADHSEAEASDHSDPAKFALARLASRTKVTGPTSGVLVISGVRCRDLTRRSGILSGVLKPYARLSAEQTTHSTSVKKGDSDPIFEGSYNFLLKDAHHALLSVQIMDKCNLKSDEILGIVSIPVRDVLDNNWKIEREFALESRSATGYVALRLAFNRAS